MSNASPADLDAARRALSRARADLDEAVAAVPDMEREGEIVSPGLLALLLRAVSAKNHLDHLVLSTTAVVSPRFVH
jgi:hypothetical protein